MSTKAGPREASTYRAARRNDALRKRKTTWSKGEYSKLHKGKIETEFTTLKSK